MMNVLVINNRPRHILARGLAWVFIYCGHKYGTWHYPSASYFYKYTHKLVCVCVCVENSKIAFNFFGSEPSPPSHIL